MFVTYLEHVQSVQALLIGSDFFLKAASEGINATFLMPVTMCTLVQPGRGAA